MNIRIFINSRIVISDGTQGFSEENLELHIKSSNALLKNPILVADGNELPDFGKKG